MAPSSAYAATSSNYLMDSSTGPVVFPACVGEITWYLGAEQIEASGSSAEAERQMWRTIFREVESLTPYTFRELPATLDPAAAMIVIGYADPTATADQSVQIPAQHLGIGGITEVAWDGSAWVTAKAFVTLNAAELHKWPGANALRGWVSRHELGHALGLSHHDDGAHVMGHRYRPGMSQARFRAEDLTALNARLDHNCAVAS